MLYILKNSLSWHLKMITQLIIRKSALQLEMFWKVLYRYLIYGDGLYGKACCTTLFGLWELLAMSYSSPLNLKTSAKILCSVVSWSWTCRHSEMAEPICSSSDDVSTLLPTGFKSFRGSGHLQCAAVMCSLISFIFLNRHEFQRVTWL